MPASRSPSRTDKKAGRPYGWLLAVGAAAALIFVLIALPASLARYFLPKSVQVEEPSGSIWHGSVARITVRGRDVGALEWHLHPAALLRGKVQADLHWIKRGFVLDSTVQSGGRQIVARNIRGGGPLEDLADLGLSRGWQGSLDISMDEFSATEHSIDAAKGSIKLEHLSSPQFGGSDVGGYQLQFGPDAVHGDGTASAQLSDLGGPLQLNGSLVLSPPQNLATLSGTVKERGDIPQQLRQALDGLAQLRGRNPQGQIPLDFEFSL